MLKTGWAWAAALAVFASLAVQSGYAGVADDFWLETHAGSDALRIGERWDADSDLSEYPAESYWNAGTGAMSEFGGGHAYSTSSLSEGVFFTYAYADATWFDRVTVYDPALAFGEQFPVCLNFDLTGILSVVESGSLPTSTTTEGRAAVTADVKSTDLGFWAHGYNMWASYDATSGVMRKSGTWELGGGPGGDGDSYVYDNWLVLPLTVHNGVDFDLFAKISVGTGAKITYTGGGIFGGLGDFTMISTADFRHSMTLGGFTDAGGNDIRDSGVLVWSEGPTFGGPKVIPEPTAFVLVISGLVGVIGRRFMRRRQ